MYNTPHQKNSIIDLVDTVFNISKLFGETNVQAKQKQGKSGNHSGKTIQKTLSRSISLIKY